MNAQFILDVSVGPKPYPAEEYYGDKVGKSIKQVVQIKTQYAAGGYHESDTIAKFEYDKGGRKIRTTRYEKNKVGQLYNYSYKGNKEMTWKPFDTKIDNTIARTIYDNEGNITAMYTYYLKGNDTLNTQWAFLKYENGKIVYREDGMNNNVNIIQEYLWEDGRVACARSQSSPGYKGMKFNYFEYIYTYNNDKLLTECNVYHQVDSVRSLSHYNKYIYDGKLLVQERYTEYGTPSQEAIVDYRYAGSKPDSIAVKNGNDVTAIAIEYNKQGKVLTKTATTNSFRSFRDIFKPMLYGLPAETLYRYKQVYTYDGKDNITLITQYLEDRIVCQMAYQIEYY